MAQSPTKVRKSPHEVQVLSRCDLVADGVECNRICFAAGVDEAVIRNIEAAKQIAGIISTSLGPNGEPALPHYIYHCSGGSTGRVLIISRSLDVRRYEEAGGEPPGQDLGDQRLCHHCQGAGGEDPGGIFRGTTSHCGPDDCQMWSFALPCPPA